MTKKSVRSEYLEHFVIFGEHHLRYLLREFMPHYLKERYHQGIGGQLIRPMALMINDTGSLGAI